jgi:peptide-methionine (S)-S-oxide reductase
MIQKIGFGGSCHWCTEAIFRSLNGVTEVAQGWIASTGDDASFSEAIIVSFDDAAIGLETLIAVHLHTHSCTSVHNMRGKYRSAIYTFNNEQRDIAVHAFNNLQAGFKIPIITKILPFAEFKLNEENYLDYYYKDPSRPFCQNIVNPKLKILLAGFADQIAPEKKLHIESI